MTNTAASRPIFFASATIIDGSEDAKPYEGHVLVADGIIQWIGTSRPRQLPPNTWEIDSTGYVLCPGFIDMHAHSDLYLLTHPEHEPKITQGCTTEVVGQDGISYSPVRTTEQMQAIRSQIAGWNGNPSDEECSTLHKGVGMFEWRTVKEYLDCLERNKTATNVAMLVPQGNLRLLACGPCDQVAEPDEIQDQVELLRQAMEDGAVGMSSGLTYTPGMYASNSELAVLCQALADHFPGAFYAPHHRSYGLRAIESYQEMLDLGKTTKCPIHLTHATLNFPENSGRAPELLMMIDETRDLGCDITLDTYPYLPGCTTLASLLPSWASSGGPDAALKRLKSRETREKIRVAIEVKGCDGGHGIPTDWAAIQVGSTTHPDLAAYDGRRVSEIANAEARPAIEVFFDILTKDRLATSCLMHIGNEENVREIMCHPTHCSGSDAILHGESLHPRAYGTFPRFLSQYSLSLALLPLSNMIAHLTSRPARRIGIYPHRGLIHQGSAADLVLFHPDQIKDEATFENPKTRAKGIRFVLVNGKVALDEGELTGMRAGRTLRRGSDGRVGTVDQIGLGKSVRSSEMNGTAEYELNGAVLNGGNGSSLVNGSVLAY